MGYYSTALIHSIQKSLHYSFNSPVFHHVTTIHLCTFHWLYKSQQQSEEGRKIFGKIPQGENCALRVSDHLNFQYDFTRSARIS